MLVVISIIGVLVVVAVPALFKNINKSKIAKVESDYNAVKSAVLMYYTDYNKLPQNLDDLEIDSISQYKKTPIGGVYFIRCKDKDNKIQSNGIPVIALPVKSNGEVDESKGDINLHDMGDSYFVLQGQVSNKLYINNQQFKKLIDDIGYENIYITDSPSGTGYQTGQICIRLSQNILPKPFK